MITSLSWLKNHLATKANLNQVVERLTEIGLEVENIKSSNSNLDNFIICKIVKSQKHPNADKLKLCEVDIGTGNLVKVVCGAQNARDGLFAVYAPPGAIIPKTNMKLKVAKIRGIESHGMLCSGYELDESSDKEGIIELDKKEKNIGEKYFKNIGEKTMDIAITPNRPDCLGVRGIARDLASSGLGQLKKQPTIKINQKFKNPIKVSIKKEKGQGCGIFGSVYIKNVQNKESPDWLKKRIISLGLKPVSAIVDTTNYIMFDLNRPLHAYDADKINQEIIVRNSTKGESFEALDNKKYTLQNNMCAISDKSGVLGLGGIIGGTRSGTELSTKNILLESAYFFPSPIRQTSKILNIDTDAKYRFERGIDPDSIKLGLELGMCMILDICGGEASKFSIAGKIKDERKIVMRSLGFFSTADSLVANNLVLSLYRHITNPECRQYLLRQSFEEAIHTHAYQYVIQSLGMDEAELFNMYREVPSVARKASWALNFTKELDNPNFKTGDIEGDKTLLRNLIAFYCVLEGIFFYCGFTQILSMGRRNKMTGTSEQFQYILRDESMHLNFGIDMINQIKLENPHLWDEEMQDQAAGMILQGMELEIEYARDTMPRGVLGMNASMMEEYLNYIANRRLVQLGLPEEFPNSENPFPWMSEIMDLRKEKNFFETRVIEYQTGGALNWD